MWGGGAGGGGRGVGWTRYCMFTVRRRDTCARMCYHAYCSALTVCLVTVRHMHTSSTSIYHRVALEPQYVFPHSHTIIPKQAWYQIARYTCDTCSIMWHSRTQPTVIRMLSANIHLQTGHNKILVVLPLRLSGCRKHTFIQTCCNKILVLSLWAI